MVPWGYLIPRNNLITYHSSIICIQSHPRVCSCCLFDCENHGIFICFNLCRISSHLICRSNVLCFGRLAPKIVSPAFALFVNKYIILGSFEITRKTENVSRTDASLQYTKYAGSKHKRKTQLWLNSVIRFFK